MLVTQSLDRRLTWSENAGVRIHLAFCDNCARFMKQMRLIRTWLNDEDAGAQPGLTDEGRKRIAEKLYKRE